MERKLKELLETKAAKEAAEKEAGEGEEGGDGLKPQERVGREREIVEDEEGDDEGGGQQVDEAAAANYVEGSGQGDEDEDAKLWEELFGE